MNGNGWEKILWRDQPFSDNYVPPSFLSALKRNANVQPYTYTPLVLATLSITQHTAVLFIFISAFIHLHNESLDPRLVVWTCIIGFFVGYIAWELVQKQQQFPTSFREQRIKTVKSSILVFLALIAVTPVLKTLTEATSSDSIWALAAILFGLNVLLADYGGPAPGPHRLTSVMSMNAAISSSVVLASRLKTNLNVFGLILFAVLLFALFPILRKRLQLCSPLVVSSITLGISGVSVVVFGSVTPGGAVLLFCALVFITFGCPAVLVWAQKFKNEIRGPWDPAVPQVWSAVE